MWRRGAALLCALVVGSAPCAAGDACYAAGDYGAVAEGRLIERDDAIILKLPRPICLSGAEDSDNVKESAEIHVYSDDAVVEETLRGLVGKDVHLRGSLMGAITQHHKAPVVMRVREADEI
jgi:uncharacterized protein DUF4431